MDWIKMKSEFDRQISASKTVCGFTHFWNLMSLLVGFVWKCTHRTILMLKVDNNSYQILWKKKKFKKWIWNFHKTDELFGPNNALISEPILSQKFPLTFLSLPVTLFRRFQMKFLRKESKGLEKKHFDISNNTVDSIELNILTMWLDPRSSTIQCIEFKILLEWKQCEWKEIAMVLQSFFFFFLCIFRLSEHIRQMQPKMPMSNTNFNGHSADLFLVSFYCCLLDNSYNLSICCWYFVLLTIILYNCENWIEC